jgi:hypothetical protein
MNDFIDEDEIKEFDRKEVEKQEKDIQEIPNKKVENIKENHIIIPLHNNFDKKYLSSRTIKNFSELVEDKKIRKEIELVLSEGVRNMYSQKLNSIILMPALLFGTNISSREKSMIIPKSNNLVSRVIFSEAASATPFERYLISSVIKNRIGHIGFNKGSHRNMDSVVKHKNQFTCINDKRNSNWKLTENISNMNIKEKEIWNQCIILSRGKFTPYKDIHFYHDKSIVKPKSWSQNKYWNVNKVLETKNFIFYKAEKN